MREIALVAGEGLVAAVSRQSNRHVSSRLLGDQERREGRLVAEGLVEGCCQPRQGGRDVFLDLQFLVDRPVALSNRPRICALVVAPVGEADRERPDRLR